ncbi:MAG: hypothetical protein QME52_03945 [Bacteroidota bacterium]|nr:hypothetical protein [Bacteroidota bacterium]
MKQYEVVIEIMKANGGFATLGHLYSEVFKLSRIEWKTKTPFASIRRIVQDQRFFFKIRPGLWALKELRHRIPPHIQFEAKEPRIKDYSHSYYQGLLVELGNLRDFQTYVPNQDKNKKYLNKPLSELATVPSIYSFSYDYLVKRAQTIDVVWFNERKMPDSFFEIEHSTDIQNSLLKFLELQDFNVNFRIVADSKRKREYQSKLDYSAFRLISQRIKFIDYETISELHSKSVELNLLQHQI